MGWMPMKLNSEWKSSFYAYIGLIASFLLIFLSIFAAQIMNASLSFSRNEQFV
jgi:hypothetical protein